MSIRKGKRYEREIARALRDLGWTVERVVGSGGFSGTSDCDLVMLPPGRPQPEGVPLSDCDGVLRAEVKYSAKASGFSEVYGAHARLVGLELVGAMHWVEDDILTAGVLGLTADVRGMEVERYAIEGPRMSTTVQGWLAGKAGRQQPDLVLCRGACLPWVAVWRPELRVQAAYVRLGYAADWRERRERTR